MKDRSGKSAFKAKIFLSLLAIATSILTVTQTATAKSLYVIADITGDPAPVQAYDIGVNGTLTFQAEHDIPNYVLGAVGLAIDSDSGYLFVTYEASDVIQLVNAKTMTDEGTTIAPDATNLAGIVYDHEKELLYCIDRNTRVLYVYDWDPNTATLTHAPDSPIRLEPWITAYGIALDEIDGLLYVASASNTIYVYSTSDWLLVRTIPVSRLAISVAVDVMNGFLYSGGGYAGNCYLTQYHLATDTEKEVQVEPDAGVIGLGVDTDTGLVYMSTGIDAKPGGDNLLVYDTSLNQIDIVNAIGNPTGLAIPGKDIGYNPHNLTKIVIEGAVGKTPLGKIESVGAGETITYGICFDNNNDYTATDVSIVDTLPDEVSFVTADDDGVNGQYDPNTHTYKWLYPSLPPGTSTCLELKVLVNQDVRPGTTITNTVTINSNQTPPTTVSLDVVTTYNALNLDKSILGSIEGQTAWVDVNETITYDIYFDNNSNDFTVKDVSVVDILPDEVNFVSADEDGVYGQYDPVTHTYTWSYPSMSPGSAINLGLVVQVNQDTVPGTTITNTVIIDSNELPPSTASVDAITYYNPLNLSKSIVGSVDGQVKWVDANEIITYNIVFDNNDNDYIVTNLSIVDTLPEEVSFVTADGDGIFGQYDPNTHTYTWSYSHLPPKTATSLKLVVQVNPDTAPATTISNYVTIDGTETPPSTAIAEATTYYSPLNLSKNIVGEIPGETMWVDVGETITYDICFNNDNNSAVTNVSIVDTLSEDVSFVTADGDGIFGEYDPVTHTYTWSYPSLSSGPDTCLELTVRVNQDTPPFTTITNSVIIDSNETPPTAASVDAMTPAGPLEVGDLSMVPNIIRRMGYSKYILALVQLPQGESIKVNGPIVLSYYPNPNTDNDVLIGTGQLVPRTAGGPNILIIFDRAQLMNTVPGYGRFKLKIKGRLNSGRSFYGEPIIYITKFIGR
ncbi:MAG: hypothetical protein ACYTFW_20085 [Planctomycetota bacterium]